MKRWPVDDCQSKYSTTYMRYLMFTSRCPGLHIAGQMSPRCLKDDLSVIFIPESAFGGKFVMASRSAASIKVTIDSNFGPPFVGKEASSP